MIVELGVVLLAAICAVGYAIHWYRGRVKWARIREDQLKRLKWLKRKFAKGYQGVG